MTAPVPAVKWLMSAYDATWHAFPAVQINERERTFYQALCEHSVPARHVERTVPRVFCPACLVLYGTHIPDDQRWRMGG
jgi:hypothetical protein